MKTISHWIYKWMATQSLVSPTILPLIAVSSKVLVLSNQIDQIALSHFSFHFQKDISNCWKHYPGSTHFIPKILLKKSTTFIQKDNMQKRWSLVLLLVVHVICRSKPSLNLSLIKKYFKNQGFRLVETWWCMLKLGQGRALLF